MSSWMKERDRLMAQTLAFVQGVTGARPEVIDKPVDTNPPAHPNPVPEAASNEIVVQPPPAPSNDVVKPNDITLTADQADDVAASAAAILSTSSIPPLPQRIRAALPPIVSAAAPPISTAQRQIPLTVGSEREDILKRVAAFRARQARLSRERETYYQDMHAKIQQKLGDR